MSTKRSKLRRPQGRAAGVLSKHLLARVHPPSASDDAVQVAGQEPRVGVPHEGEFAEARVGHDPGELAPAELERGEVRRQVAAVDVGRLVAGAAVLGALQMVGDGRARRLADHQVDVAVLERDVGVEVELGVLLVGARLAQEVRRSVGLGCPSPRSASIASLRRALAGCRRGAIGIRSGGEGKGGWSRGAHRAAGGVGTSEAHRPGPFDQVGVDAG